MFVSSTCYDLNKVRADMKRFLENMGLDPVRSETPAFPVSPQTSPVENCLRAVKERADIFVLIVGARYGSQNGSGRSVTNLEYLEAKAKGIPVYVFVLKQILSVLPVWKMNPQANYQGTVDTPKLFEFVEMLRGPQHTQSLVDRTDPVGSAQLYQGAPEALGNAVTWFAGKSPDFQWPAHLLNFQEKLL
ncbi:MAG: DUF4062 domain-containing protein [Verrucomicrobiota bacterium]